MTPESQNRKAMRHAVLWVAAYAVAIKQLEKKARLGIFLAEGQKHRGEPGPNSTAAQGKTDILVGERVGVHQIDELLSQRSYVSDGQGNESLQKLYHLIDGLGSVYGLTNAAGVKVASYNYDAYGALTSAEVQPGMGINNPYLFTGRELDADSGLQYNRARYYLSGIGSWNREDPLKSDILGLTEELIDNVGSPYENPYTYVRARPSVHADPHGLASWLKIVADFVCKTTVGKFLIWLLRLHGAYTAGAYLGSLVYIHLAGIIFWAHALLAGIIVFFVVSIVVYIVIAIIKTLVCSMLMRLANTMLETSRVDMSGVVKDEEKCPS